jgi:hypothetical protein
MAICGARSQLHSFGPCAGSVRESGHNCDGGLDIGMFAAWWQNASGATDTRCTRAVAGAPISSGIKGYRLRSSDLKLKEYERRHPSTQYDLKITCSFQPKFALMK